MIGQSIATFSVSTYRDDSGAARSAQQKSILFISNALTMSLRVLIIFLVI